MRPFVIVAMLAVAGTAAADNHAIHGKVIARNAPVANATVTISGATIVQTDCTPVARCTTPAPIDTPIVITTDADGAFTIDSTPDGSYVIDVNAKGYRHKARSLSLHADKTVTIEVHKRNERI
jgi:uncharacterized GH25 family protein